MVTREDTNRLAAANKKISDSAQQAAQEVLQKIASAPTEAARIALIDELIPAVASQYSEQIAMAAAKWYEEVRADALPDVDDGFEASLAQTYSKKAIVEEIHDHILSNRNKFDEAIVDAMDRWIKIPGRATIAENCKRDPKKPRYALVPQGKTCAFCTMLAGRGFVYKSEKTAHKMHNHCDCVACPEWGANPNKIRGYNPDALSDEWDKAKKIVWEKNKAEARKNGKDASEVFEPGMKEILAQLRKTPGLCSDSCKPVNNAKSSKGSINIPDGARVNSKEKRAMQWIAQSGHNVTANPVKNIQNQKNPDFTIDKETWELKTISGNGKNTIDNALKHASKQSANVILDITDSNMPRDLINTIVQKRLSREDTKLNCVCIIENGKINYYKRAGHSPKPTP
ncbi:hypothetical protein ACMZ7N_04210 [Gardnerella pickettii]|uniref:VG15 protein n=1 Tax=Gardnerella pickettii TaxID=2914924 RepID=UPI0039F02BD8